MADPRLLSDEYVASMRMHCAGSEDWARWGYFADVLAWDRAARQERERADVDLMERLDLICANLEFAGHDKRCPTQRTDGAACTCGRDATIAALRARLEEPHA